MTGKNKTLYLDDVALVYPLMNISTWLETTIQATKMGSSTETINKVYIDTLKENADTLEGRYVLKKLKKNGCFLVDFYNEPLEEVTEEEHIAYKKKKEDWRLETMKFIKINF